MIRIAKKIQPLFSTTPRVMFTGGGTGGHLFPALAVANSLQQRHRTMQIMFAGTDKQAHREHVEQAGFQYRKIQSHPWPRTALDTIKFIGKNYHGFRQATQILKQEKISVVVATGGYVSAPMARAAISCNIPLVLMEHNLTAGKVNRWLASKADAICVAFAETTMSLPNKSQVHVTGTPLRNEFFQSVQSKNQKKQLLILGGSGGAAVLNEQVPLALQTVSAQLEDWQIVHQCGMRNIEQTDRAYQLAGITAQVIPFIDDMPQMIANTDLVIGRAGGATLAELSAAAVPAIIVPYPFAADDHQRANAKHYRNAGACKLIDQRWGDVSKRLSMHLETLLDDGQQRQALSTGMKQMACDDATSRVADCVERFLV